MKNLMMFLCGAALVASVQAAGWNAGQGVANDRATGLNSQDVTFVARDAQGGYGWRQYDLPIGLTVLPWSLPNFESSVYGVRLDLGWGSYKNTYGLCGGAISRGERFGGISGTFLGNIFTEETQGLVVGGVNISGSMYGLQIGFVNFAEHLEGVQIGVLNFNKTGITMPIINVGL